MIRSQQKINHGYTHVHPLIDMLFVVEKSIVVAMKMRVVLKFICLFYVFKNAITKWNTDKYWPAIKKYCSNSNQ